jgi:hypothetical protein
MPSWHWAKGWTKQPELTNQQMAFKLHKESRDWFKKIFGKSPFGTMFDLYQACLILGLAAERCEPDESSMTEFMDEFIQRYRPYQTTIIGSMISVVLKRKGISYSDREAVAKEISRLVSGDSASGDLTVEGFRELNGYALGGFNLLRESFNSPPQHTASFLAKYRKILDETTLGLQI